MLLGASRASRALLARLPARAPPRPRARLASARADDERVGATLPSQLHDAGNAREDAFFRAEDAKALHALYQRARARECAAERAALDEILARTTAASDDALKRALLAWKHKHHE